MTIQKSWSLFKLAFKGFNEDKCPILAAALSYYTLFSLAPMLVIILSVGSFFLGNEEVQKALFSQIQNLIGAEGAASVQTMMQNAYRPQTSAWMTAIGIGTLLAGATTVFIQMQDAFNIIWHVKSKPRINFLKKLRDRVLSFGMILGVGFLLSVSLALNAGLSIAGRFLTDIFSHLAVFLRIAEIALSLFLNAVLFGMMFKFLPDVKIKWRDVRTGALITSGMFAVGKVLIGFYLGNSGVASAYGAAAAVVVLVLWVNYSSLILFFGAEFTKVYAMQSGSEIRPVDYAVRVMRKEEVLR